jgi:hypothetical protein
VTREKKKEMNSPYPGNDIKRSNDEEEERKEFATF